MTQASVTKKTPTLQPLTHPLTGRFSPPKIYRLDAVRTIDSNLSSSRKSAVIIVTPLMPEQEDRGNPVKTVLIEA